ncbi:MAG: hypothetical protein DM484_09655 [Candidatus Methylumidiphilus alinenensis]|uniref:DUF2283 domain-containing protein n=1 Tax=Candidatus Methylumidiphilus alinenensis TaxID=2202197 RepID=A0A2W4TD34_9GAMM|nr:MAG: hypothetical protein DM484_09655 [Candidatus Methylumidiphilus alinenensis]
MKLSYDIETDSLYIHLSETPSADSDEVADGIVLDFSASGALVGIDVQHASERADIQSVILPNLPLQHLKAA